MSTQGDKGAKGDKGERGEGMSPGTRRAIVVLFAIAVALAVAAVLFAVGYYHRSQGTQQQQAAAEQASQRRQAQVFEMKLCTTLDKLAARQPPPGPPADLSRQYLEWQYGVLAQLGPDVGCGKARP